MYVTLLMLLYFEQAYTKQTMQIWTGKPSDRQQQQTDSRMRLNICRLVTEGNYVLDHCNSVFYSYLDLEGSLKAAGKEATKGSHNGGERGQSYAVDLEWIETHCGLWRQERRVRLKQSRSTENSKSASKITFFTPLKLFSFFNHAFLN